MYKLGTELEARKSSFVHTGRIISRFTRIISKNHNSKKLHKTACIIWCGLPIHDFVCIYSEWYIYFSPFAGMIWSFWCYALSILLKETRVCVCVFAKLDQFLPVWSQFDSNQHVNSVRIATFQCANFGPLLFAFYCPLLFYEKKIKNE